MRRVFLWLIMVANHEELLANNISQQASLNVIDIQFLVEDRGRYDIERVQTFDESLWTLAKQYPLNLGNLKHGAWIRFNLLNVEGVEVERIVEFANSGLHKLSIFMIRSNGRIKSWELGSYLPFFDRPILNRNFAIPLFLEAGEGVRVYARAESNTGVLIPISVHEESEFWYQATKENLIYGLYFGVLIMFIAFNIGMYLVRNNYVFLLLALDLLLFALMYANHLGLNFEYLWPVDPHFNYLAGLFFSYLVVFSANVFTWHFLKFEECFSHVVFYYTFNFLALFGVVALWFIPINISSFFCALLGVGVAIYFAILSAIQLRSGAEFSIYYFVSYVFAALTTIIYVAHKLALLPTNYVTNYAIGYSILLQSIVLTCVLLQRKMTVKKIIGFEGEAKAIPHSARDWIAQFSHEIRTPLNGVIGMAELLKETPLNPTQFNYLKVLSSSGEHLIELVTDVLDYESISSGEVELNEAPFEFKLLCEDVLKLFQRQAADNHVELTLELDSSLPHTFIGDSKRLKQILINLLSNSIKFTFDGQVTIAAKFNRQNLFLSISDNGIGMTHQQQEEVFERFRQADQSIYTKYGGSGLGLSICHQLIKLMQGSIEVNSKLGLFTCFNIKLPLKAAFSSSPEQPFFQPNLTDTGGIGSNKQRGSSTQTGVELVVLGVDDNEINRRVLAAMLKKLGHKMIEASSGEEAIGIVKSGVFIDLILMDCEMPKMNGFETTRAIKQWQYGQAAKPCPIIALTAHVLEEHEIRCADAGMDGRLCKPLHLNDLKALLLDINAEGVAKH